MNKIQLLSEQVANQIAAGEVIERPASVLKELIENSLDAGATQIGVISRGGGRQSLQVTDNGCGMNRDDALLCLERHATSKLRESADLQRIASYGFRGEAIPSIASVSKFKLRTREASALSGSELLVNGGKLVQVSETGMAPGTQIEVRSLFFNLPARRKFLRTESTEMAHLKHQLILAGLARPEVGFSVGYDEAPLLRWPAQQSLGDRLGAIYGAEFLNSLLEVKMERGDFRLRGFIGKPGVSRAGRTEEHVFVNQRPVVNRTIQFALQEGYHNALMRGRFPVAVLFLEMDPGGVDVNIHPAKREVRFHDDFSVRQFVAEAVRKTLQGFESAPIAVSFGDASEKSAPKENRSYFFDSAAAKNTGSTFAPAEKRTPDFQSAPASTPVFPAEKKAALVEKENPAPLTAEKTDPSQLEFKQEITPSFYSPPPVPKPTQNRLFLRIFGAVANLYLVAESPEGLVLIDQHAAHERVLFEQMMRRLAKQELLSQRLLLPVTVKLPPRESEFLARQLEVLNQIGIGISEFGENSFLVDALPPTVKPKEIAEFIRTLVIELEQSGSETRRQNRLSEETIVKTVCRHAIKANDQLKPEEWEALLSDLLACDLPYTCPHGRPTMIQFSLAELEKKFGRAG